jgi:hypothetical protein
LGNKIIPNGSNTAITVQFDKKKQSPGAAISGFSAIEIAMNVKNLTDVFMNNFGMPRIGNPEFAAAFAKTVRF